MLGEALFEQGALGVGQGAHERLARIERGAAQHILGQRLRAVGVRIGRQGGK